MKKSVIIIVALVAVILFSVFANAYAESREEYYYKIEAALEKLRVALDDHDKQAANKALDEVRTLVYACMRYLASIGEYDSRVMQIADNANKAYTACFNGLDYKEYFIEAKDYNSTILGSNITIEPEEDHS